MVERTRFVRKRGKQIDHHHCIIGLTFFLRKDEDPDGCRNEYTVEVYNGDIIFRSVIHSSTDDD